jgi:hypothetical protein
MGKYAKSAVAFVGAVAETVLVYLDDNSISAGEWPLIVAGIATLVGVYFVPNKTESNV